MSVREKEKVELLQKVLEDPTLYNIVSAIRGPDLHYESALKVLFTIPLRYIASGAMSPAEAIRTFMNPTQVRIVLEGIHDVRGNFGHWTSHIIDAYDALFYLGLIDARIRRYVDVVLEIISYAHGLTSVTSVKLTNDMIDRYVKEVEEAYKEEILCEDESANSK